MRYVLAMVGLAILSLASCLDEKPIVVEKKNVGLPLHDECLACLSTPDDPGPGCATEFRGCTDHTTCDTGIRYCLAADNCIGGTLDLYLACIPKCTQVGHISNDDPG